MPRKTKLLANTLKAAKNEHDLSRYLDDLDQDESWIGFRDYFFSIPKADMVTTCFTVSHYLYSFHLQIFFSL